MPTENCASRKKTTAKQDIDRALAFTQPRISYGTDVVLYFYAFDDHSMAMKRKRVKLNHLGTRKSIRKREKQIVSRFTEMLSLGWNPFCCPDTDAILTRPKPAGKPVVLRSAEGCIDEYLTFIEREAQRKVLSDATFKTYRSYSRSLLSYLHSVQIVNLQDVTLQVLNDFLASLLDRNVTVKYYNSTLGFLKTVFTWFVEHGKLESSPADGLKKETTARVTAKRENLSADELATLFEKLRKAKRLEFLLACYMEYYCYIRPNELYQLKVGDLNFAEQSVFVSAAISKTKRDAKVTLPAVVIELMVELGIHKHRSNEYIFGDRLKCSDKMGTQKQFGRYWDRHVACDGGLMPELQKRNVCFYSLKSTGITDMLERGVASLTVRDQARHSNLSTTEIYAKKSKLTVSEELKGYI